MMMPRLLSSVLTVTLVIGFAQAQIRPHLDMPARGETVAGYSNPDSIKARLAATRLLPIEGLWEFTADGSIAAIERVATPTRVATNTYRIVLVICADRSVAPGTLMGYAIDTPTPGIYDAKLYSRYLDGSLVAPQSFKLEITPRGALTMRHYREGYYVMPWKLLPRQLPGAVGRRQERPQGLDGLIRLYPRSTFTPRYL